LLCFSFIFQIRSHAFASDYHPPVPTSGVAGTTGLHCPALQFLSFVLTLPFYSVIPVLKMWFYCTFLSQRVSCEE
jgi:hypothetical protein